MITIVGGVYRERCMRPASDDIYGSAGRAATAIARFGGQAELNACVDSSTQIVVDARAIAEGFQFNATAAQAGVTFEYIHGLANPDIRRGTHVKSKLRVSAEKVLRFGMIDGTAVINAEYAVFDPQNVDGPESFGTNGSKAKHLALVLNRYEANLLVSSSSGLSAEALAITLAEQENAEVVVIKMGPLGALVYDNSAISTVPAYRTERVWKIGSGDTFAAHFALGWMDNGLSAHEAASIASIATAFYCQNRGFPDSALLADFKPQALQPSARYRDGYAPKVYLAGPFFTLAELWMVGQARRDLLAMGLDVFSPYHDVGLGSAEDVVEKDLDGVRDCDALFAIGDGLDSGTIYEIGYARALNKPVVFYAENESEQDKKMLEGSDCRITDDYVSAIYQDGLGSGGAMKTGLLLSGGMDSLTLAWWKRPDIALTLDYGQLAAQAEIEASSTICQLLGIPHHVIEINCRQLGSGDMAGRQADSLAPASDWWPYRNQMLVTLAAMKAITFGVTHLWLGTVKSDEFHRDGSPEFMSAISHLLSLQEGGMVVEAPAIKLSTSELVRKSGIPASFLAWAHSCHKSNVACGNCRGCNKYMEVFQEVGYDLDRPR